MATTTKTSKSKSKLPVDKVLDVLKSGKESAKSQQEPVFVGIHVCEGAPADITLAVKEAFLPQMPDGYVSVTSSERTTVPQGFSPDVCVVIVGTEAREAASMATSFVRLGVPVALVAQSTLDVPRLDLGDEQEALVSTVAATSVDALMQKLAEWLVRSSEKSLSMAAHFPFCRKAKVSDLINACSLQNAGVGAVSLIPGADLPVMTANQAKLALDIAAAHGEGLSAGRAVELAGVVGAGFAYRQVARTVLGAIPVAGIAIKAVMGYAGTQATGRAVATKLAASKGDGTDVRARAEAAANVVRDMRSRIGTPSLPKAQGKGSGKAQSDASSGGEYVKIG